jgi:urease accessory protein
VRARAELVVGAAGRIERLLDAPPVAFRPTPEGVYLVGTAASPTGADRVELDVTLRPGAALTVRSSAATVIWAGQGSSQTARVRVGEAASLDWAPEPLIVTSRADHLQCATLELAGGATLDWTEVVVLGRRAELPGRADLRLEVDVDGWPLLRHQLRVGPGALGWDGPAVLGANRAVALRLLAGTDRPVPSRRLGQGWSWLELDGPGWLLVAVADDLPGLRQRLADAGPVVMPTAR